MTIQNQESERGIESRTQREIWEAQLEAEESWVLACQRMEETGEMERGQLAKVVARIMLARRIMLDRAWERLKKAKQEAESSAEVALTDELTQLPNKRFFEERLRELSESGKPFGLMVVDLNGFKEINDTEGHKAGDVTLIQAGQNLRAGLRTKHDGEEEDFMARYGGDEFVFLLPGVSSVEDLTKIAARVSSTFLKLPISYPVTISLGAGLYEQGMDREELFRNVDAAMYKAKENKQKDANSVVVIGKDSTSDQLEAEWPAA